MRTFGEQQGFVPGRRRHSSFSRGTGMCAVFGFKASGAQSRSKPRVSRPATNQVPPIVPRGRGGPSHHAIGIGKDDAGPRRVCTNAFEVAVKRCACLAFRISDRTFNVSRVTSSLRL
jgi:ribosomal protein L37E